MAAKTISNPACTPRGAVVSQRPATDQEINALHAKIRIPGYIRYLSLSSLMRAPRQLIALLEEIFSATAH